VSDRLAAQARATGRGADAPVLPAARAAGVPWAAAAVTGAVLGAFVLAALLPLPAGLTRPGAYALAALFAAVVLWGSNLEDPALSGLAVVLALAFLGVIPFADAVAGFGTEFVWLLVATFILAQAMADTGLGRRIALLLLHRAGDRPAAILFTLLLSVVVLAFLVPTAAGRISVILPVVLGIVEATGLSPTAPYARAMLIGTSHASIMSGVGLMTAAGATVYAAGAFETLLGAPWRYPAWLGAFLPVVLLFIVAEWWWLLWLFRPGRETLAGGAAYVADELRRLGGLSRAERAVLTVFAAVILLWVVGPRWGVTTPQAGMLGAALLLLPGVRVLTWERALAAVRWNVVILFGLSLALATALERSGAAAWLTRTTLGLLADPAPALLLGVLAPLVVLVRVGFVNNLGMVAVALPLAFTLARGWGLNPVWVGMVVVLTAGPGFLLPTQTPTGVITFGFEAYTMRDYLRAGVGATMVLLALTWLAALVYWPLLGYRP